MVNKGVYGVMLDTYLATSHSSASSRLPSITWIFATVRLFIVVSRPLSLLIQVKADMWATQPDSGIPGASQHCISWLDCTLIWSVARTSFTTSRNCERVKWSWLILVSWVDISYVARRTEGLRIILCVQPIVAASRAQASTTVMRWLARGILAE